MTGLNKISFCMMIIRFCSRTCNIMLSIVGFNVNILGRAVAKLKLENGLDG